MSSAQMQINVGANVTQAVAGLNQVNQAATQTATTLNKVKQPTDAAAFALTNLGRVAQDAPFGFVAIQNNLNPLLESFQRLKVQATEAGTTLSSTLIQALKGAGGLGIALSVASAAITIFTNGLGAWTRGFSSNKKEVDAAQKSLEDYNKTVAQSGSEVGKEVTKVTELVQALRTQNLIRKEQKAGIEELIKIAPEYFTGLDKEKNFINSLNYAYQAYLNSLQKAIAGKVLEKQLEDLFQQKFKIQAELDSVNISTNPQVSKQINDLEARLKAIGKAGIVGPNDDIFNLSKSQQEAQKIRESLISLKNIRTIDLSGQSQQLIDINKQIDGLTIRLGELKGRQPVLDVFNPEKGKTALQILQEQRSELEKQLKLLQEIDKAGKLPIFRQHEIADLQTQILKIDAVIDKLPQVNVDIKNDIIQEALDKKVTALPPLELKKGEVYVEVAPTFKLVEGKFALDSAGGFTKSDVRTAREGIEDSINTQLAANPLNLHPSVVITRMSLDAKEAAKALQALNDELTVIARQTFADIGSTVGDAIGDAISGKGIGEAFQQLGEIIANAFKSIGKALLAYAATMLVAKVAIKSGNPYLALAAGILIEAAGTALENNISKQTPFAEGGIVTGPTNALIGEAGTEFVLPLSRMNQFVKSIQGANGSMNIVGETRISGNDLFITYNRAARSNNRIN